MTTLTIENTIAKGTYFKRSTGKTGQVIGSPELEAKLTKVETLYRRYYGKPMGRGKFYDLVLGGSRDVKSEAGGYIQYTGECVAGIWLDQMHKTLGAAVRRKDRETVLSVDLGQYQVSNMQELAREVRGKAKLPVHPRSGKRILTPRTQKEVA
jgi:hypothetical protein